MTEVKGTAGKALASGAAAAGLTFLWFGGRDINLSTFGMKSNAAIVVGAASAVGNLAGDTVAAAIGGWMPGQAQWIQKSAPLVTAVGALAVASPNIVIKRPLEVVQIGAIVYGADMVADWLLSSMPSLNANSLMTPSDE